MYYLIHDGVESGPFDMIALVRKVKNGSLTPQTMVRSHTSPAPVAAGSVKELLSLFSDAGAVEAAPQKAAGPSEYDLKQVTKNAMRFSERMNPLSMIVRAAGAAAL